MGMFNCEGCKAKEAELERLERELERVHKQLERAVARAFEAASPGVTQRVEAKPPAPPRPLPPHRPNLPGYEAPPERDEVVLTGVES